MLLWRVRLSGRRTDSASRIIKAAPSVIYRALIDAEALATWLPPEGMRGRFDFFELREGGRYRLTLTYIDPGDAAPGKSSADEDVVLGRFMRLVPDREVVQLGEFETDDPDFAGGMMLTWSLHPVQGGTEVRIVAENVPAAIRKEDHDAGLASSLANLAAYVEEAG